MKNDSPVKPLQMTNKMPFMIGVGVLVVLVGIGIGWMVSSKKVTKVVPSQPGAGTTVSQTEAGAKDASSFKDTATGTLTSGGIKGEGTFHLDRPGGATKTVYLTSTVIDMTPFVGKKVQVWGQTLASKYAPWFMDVGKIKVVE